MINSAATVPDAPTVASPEFAMDFDTWKGQSKYHGFVDPNSFVGKIANFFDGSGDRMRRDYEKYLDDINLRNEKKAAQSAQAYDEWKDRTVYSRGFDDLERMGVNPYLLLNSGSTPATGTGGSSKPSYSYSKPGLKDSTSNTKGRDLALIVLAIAKIAATMAA